MKRTSDFADKLLAALVKAGYKIKDLSSIPEEEFDSYRDMSSRQMVEIYAKTHAPAGRSKRNRIVAATPQLVRRYINLNYE